MPLYTLWLLAAFVPVVAKPGVGIVTPRAAISLGRFHTPGRSLHSRGVSHGPRKVGVSAALSASTAGVEVVTLGWPPATLRLLLALPYIINTTTGGTNVQ